MTVKGESPLRLPRWKRAFDLILTLPGLIIISPLLLIIALALLITQGTPIIFKQQRPGLKGKPFQILKFRTMSAARDEAGDLLPDGQRLTTLGRLLRAFSLDELPELINVIRGEMSLVGPRPLLTEYLELYSQEQRRRHDMLPGITGWTQINGRNALTWEDKFRFDVWYVENWSLALDVKILLITFWKVIKREGISQPGHATAQAFKGSSAGQGDDEPKEAHS
jgi:lipopolysaccharide/colanic/teichoic acid biosynthesis glycosyltransferase